MSYEECAHSVAVGPSRAQTSSHAVHNAPLCMVYVGSCLLAHCRELVGHKSIVYYLECTKNHLRIVGEHAPRPSFGYALWALTHTEFACYDVPYQ